MHVLLETERLTLRRFTEADASHLYELDNDPEVMRFINGGIATPRSTIDQKILPTFLEYNDGYPAFGFWAADNKQGEFLGWFVFRPTATDSSDVEIGYRLRRACWGAGYATEGARALIDAGFARHGVTRVSATTYEANHPSRRVMEKLGMRLVRTFRPTAEDLDSDTAHMGSAEVWDGDDVEYAIERASWLERRA